MVTKGVWKGSAVLLFLFFKACAGRNDSHSLDVQPSSPPSVTTNLTSAVTDGVKPTRLGMSASPLDAQHTNETTANATITGSVRSLNSDNDRNNSNARMETTLAPPTSNLTTISLTPTRRDPKKTQPGEIKWDAKWNEPFEYDYSSLRHAGLTIAAVLFILGIMVITCGKMRCSRRCRMSKGRSYEVTRM
ncbi:hypothetical protein PHYPO_G00055560 [Pangasianodon hypophthalmus]|uniref:FXYD domain-containing ion transport regulator n=1 Tax=Pangasianodon hypophthalmus TaxID=310915 RepID=A0A5N5M6M4_PANHP|nr:FXYD domain containing ion transport regulator 5 [Pangasianodon hypophthalmus]KAB5550598.1 hypothetical protein PHYPO_G00055560 [Pangasianodon hypophthalmus]